MAEAKKRCSEDWLAVYIGLLVFLLSLLVFAGLDALGWALTTSGWPRLATALKPVSPSYANVPAVLSLFLTYLFLLVLTTAGAWGLGANWKRFAKSFTGVFFLSYACWIAGAYARIAATPNQRAAQGKIGRAH